MIERTKVHAVKGELPPSKIASEQAQIDYLNKLLHIQTSRILDLKEQIEELEKENLWLTRRLYSNRLWMRIRRLFG